MTGIANSPDDVMALKWNQLQPRILAYAMLLNRTCLRDLLDKVKEKDIPNGKHCKVISWLALPMYIHLQSAWGYWHFKSLTEC